MNLRQLTGKRPGKSASTAIVATLASVLLSCGGQSYNCGPGAAPCTATSQHCYGIVDWSGTPTGLSTELTAVALTSGDGFVNDEVWLWQVVGTESYATGSWVEAGEINVYGSPDYFWAEGKNFCTPDQYFMWYDLGPIAQNDLNNNTWIAYKINQDSKTPSMWNVTISYAQTGQVLFNEAATEHPMTPNTVQEGQELQGTNSAEAPGAFFAYNAFYQGSIKSFWTTDGSVSSGNPPHGGWWPGSKPSQTSNGGLFFTWCC
jgi:hypothetical protein